MTDTPAAPDARPKGGRALAAAAAVLFVGWLCVLGYTALTRSPAPYVSRAQAAGAGTAVVAELTDGADGKSHMLLRGGRGGPEVIDLKEKAGKPAVRATVVESLKGGPEKGLEKGAAIGVTNLPTCTGYAGPGTYLLLLTAEPDARLENLPAYTLAGAQRSPGVEASEGGSARIYLWNETTSADLRKQVEALFR